MTTKPMPRITPDSALFWAATAVGRFELPFCRECGRAHLPPGPVCPHCFSDHLEWRPASGRGRIATYTIVHKAWFEAFASALPYNVAQVELDEGPRLTASIVGVANDQLAVGLPVAVEFESRAPIALPRFRVVAR